jgi:hypothetical protein
MSLVVRRLRPWARPDERDVANAIARRKTARGRKRSPCLGCGIAAEVGDPRVGAVLAQDRHRAGARRVVVDLERGSAAARAPPVVRSVRSGRSNGAGGRRAARSPRQTAGLFVGRKAAEPRDLDRLLSGGAEAGDRSRDRSGQLRHRGQPCSRESAPHRNKGHVTRRAR